MSIKKISGSISVRSTPGKITNTTSTKARTSSENVSSRFYNHFSIIQLIMLEKCVLTILELNWNQRLGHKKTKLSICHHMLMSYQYYVNCGHTNEVKMWSLQLWLRFQQSQIKPEKCFRGFNGIRTSGVCVSDVVLRQLNYEDPYVGSRPIYWVHRTRERNETYQYYVNCGNCGHTNEVKMWSS